MNDLDNFDAQVDAINSKRWKKLLDFIPAFEEFTRNNDLISIKYTQKSDSKTDMFHYPIYNNEINNFYDYCSSNIIIPFAWPYWWQQHGQKYIDEGVEKLKEADIYDCVKLLTTHIRGERFCDGHIESMIKNGHLLALLKRISDIVKNSKKPKNKAKIENAKLQLENMGFAFTEQDFIKSFETWNYTAIKYFADAGMNMNIKNKDGNTALILAARGGDLKLVSLLIAKKADLNVKGTMGWTALVHSVYARHNAVIKLLVKKGADPSIKTDDNISILDNGSEFSFGDGWDEFVRGL